MFVVKFESQIELAGQFFGQFITLLQDMMAEVHTGDLNPVNFIFIYTWI